MKYEEVAKQIIANNIYMTIATASKNGSPWISPVFFAYDDDFNLYWVSNKESKHSMLLKENPQAAIVIFDSTAPEGEGDGVYFEVVVNELENEAEITKAMDVLGKRVSQNEFRVKEISEVTKTGVWRIYKAIPKNISKLTEGKIVNGQYIDQRADIDLTS